MAVSLKRHKEILFQYLKPQKARVAILSVSLLTGTVLQLIEPQILRYFIDTATKGGAMPLLMIAATLFMVAAITHQVLSVVTTYLSENVSCSGKETHHRTNHQLLKPWGENQRIIGG